MQEFVKAKRWDGTEMTFTRATWNQMKDSNFFGYKEVIESFDLPLLSVPFSNTDTQTTKTTVTQVTTTQTAKTDAENNDMSRQAPNTLTQPQNTVRQHIQLKDENGDGVIDAEDLKIKLDNKTVQAVTKKTK